MSRLLRDQREGEGTAPHVPGVEPILVMEDIRKRFGSVQALDGARFEARSAEVHALLGENGAGKTTIMNVLSGLYRPDSGTIRLHGAPLEIATPRDAIAHRIGMVHQHTELVDVFTAYENIVLGAHQRWYASDESAHRQRIRELCERYGLQVALERPVKELSAGERQKVEILRALYRGLDILILDEPTTHLTPTESQTLFASIRQLVDNGLTVIFISHKLREVLAVADRITVLRKGRTVGTVDAATADEAAIVSMLMGAGRSLTTVERNDHSPGQQALLALQDARSAEVTAPVHLTVHAGEMVGIAGVAGNGQRALVDLITGAATCLSGTISLNGEDVTSRSVAGRIKAGLSVLPDDRLREGILPSAPLYESYILGLHHRNDQGRWRRQRLRAMTRDAIATFNVATPSEDIPSAALSGGNIQKVLVARALAIVSGGDGGVIVAMNPTNGLDVAAAAFVHRQLLAFCESGGGVLLLSEDLDELFLLCDRIMALHARELVSEHHRNHFDRYLIGADMVGASNG